MTIASDMMALLGRVLVPAVAFDAQGRIAAANEAMARCLALDPTESIGTTLADRLADPAPLADLLRGAPGAAREFRFRAGDGGERYLYLSIAMRSAGGVLLIAFDATPYRLLETSMQEEIARYRDMTRAASDWFFELDAAMTRIRLIYRRTMTGDVALVERSYKWPDEVVDVAYDPDGFSAAMRTMRAHETLRDYIHRQIGRNGKERYLRSCAVPFYGPDGVFQGYRGVSVDVTAQVLAERALREREAQLRRSQQHLERAQRVAATGSTERDLVSGSEEWSAEMYRLLGVDPASFVPTADNILALVHETDRDRVKEAMAMAAAGLRPQPGEFRTVRGDGDIRTLYCETDVVCDKKGRPVRSTAVFKDVTELRAAEQRQSDTERQLLHAQKMEALGTLAGGIAHDLNNTLVPILALTKVTANRLPERSRERGNLATVLQASERARELVQQILAFSRKQTAEKRYFDLAATTREALQMLRAGLPTTLKLRDRIAEVPRFFGDAGQMHQVVVNLVTNAAQAIGEAMGTVTVELAPLAGESTLCLAVADTGCGMDEATIARIFEPFFTTKAVGRGTGLGLSLVHSIISSHGGRIEVQSGIGQGTRFAIYLPLPPDAARRSNAVRPSEAGAALSAAK